MPDKPFLFIHITLILLVLNVSAYAENLKIIPLNKPTLEKKVIKKK